MNNDVKLNFSFDFLQNDTQHAKIAKDSLYSMNQILNKLEQEYNTISLESLEEQMNLFLTKCNEFCLYVPVPKNQLYGFLDEIALKLRDIAISFRKNNKIQESDFLLNFAYKFVRDDENKKKFFQVKNNNQKISMYFKIVLMLLCILLLCVGYIGNNQQILGIGMVATIMTFALCFSRGK